MKTAQETYDKAATYISDCLNNGENPSSKVNQIEGAKIIEEYAQQEAIEFTRWKDDNFIQKKGLYMDKLDSTYEVHRLFTVDQLHKLYQDEKLAASKG